MIEKILAYQSTDAKLRDIEQELLASEDRKKAKAAQNYLKGVEELVAKLDMRAAELSAAYEAAVQKQVQLKEEEKEFVIAIENLENEGQASYLLRKIEELIGQIKALGDEADKINEEIQNVLKEYAMIKNKSKAAQAQFAEYGPKYNALKASKQAEMDAIKKELEKQAKGIDAALLEKYNAKRAAKIFPVLVELQESNVCGGCWTEVYALDVSRLQKGEIIEHVCGRLLYKK